MLAEHTFHHRARQLLALIESTLEAAGGVQKRAAELLHIKPTTLNEMIKRYEIRPRRKRTVNGNGNGNGNGDDAAAPAAVGVTSDQPTRVIE